MYRACARIGSEVLLSAAGRPYEPADAGNLKPALQRTWFNHYLLEAEEDQRWSRFNAVLDHMPSTALAAFVKSRTGQEFLRGFTGPEAMFVRLIVEELPGCKRVAATLFPEETERKDG